MNRQQIIKAVTKKTGISRKDTAKVFSSIFETILESLEKAKTRLKANVNFDLVMELLFLTIKEN